MPPGNLSTTFFRLASFRSLTALSSASPFGGGGEHLSSIRVLVKSFVRLLACSRSARVFRAAHGERVGVGRCALRSVVGI